MPFYNVSSEEAKGISEFTERRASRKTMTFVGGHKGPVESTTEERGGDASATPYLDCVVGVVESVLRRHALTCRAPADIKAPHASFLEGSLSSPLTPLGGAAHGTGERPYPFPSLFLHTPQLLVEMQDALAGSSRTASKGSKTSSSVDDKRDGSSDAAMLSAIHCTPNAPPVELLYTQPCASLTEKSHVDNGGDGASSKIEVGKVRGCSGGLTALGLAGRQNANTTGKLIESDNSEGFAIVPAPLPYDTSIQFPPELCRSTAAVQPNVSLNTARRMVNVSLTPILGAGLNRGGFSSTATRSVCDVAPVQQMVQVVQQAEAALVVAGPPLPLPLLLSTDGMADSKTATEDNLTLMNKKAAAAAAVAVTEAPFLLSPDATSCVLVACRVTLHPDLKHAIVGVAGAALDVSKWSAALREKFPNDYNARATFLRSCLNTASACMVHFDRTEGLLRVLQAMVWDSAVPAFVHAVHHHYDKAYAATGTTEPVTALQVLQETLYVVYTCCACIRENNEASTVLFSKDVTLPSVHVDWYVVGGIRMKKSAAPVLEAVFRAFFPSTTGPSRRSPSSATATADASVSPILLKESIDLHTLLPTPSSPFSSTTTAVKPLCLHVMHRLREDGQCFWSFNTTFQPWCVDPNPKQRYAYPMTWGLLLSVSTGHCWPATVQPGTRMVPMSEVRSTVTQFGYRWVTPLESDAHRHNRNKNDECKQNAKQPSKHQVRCEWKKTQKEEKCEKDWENRSQTATAAAALTVLCNTVPSATVAQRLQKLNSAMPPALRLWSSFHIYASPNNVSAAQPQQEGNAPLFKLTLTLASYVRTMLVRQDAWWARRLSNTSVSEDSQTPQRVFPVLVRRHYTSGEINNNGGEKGNADEVVSWSRLPLTQVEHVLTQPKVSFLSSSTTPHCEPPDFCDLVRNHLLWRTSVGSTDVFVNDTDSLCIE